MNAKVASGMVAALVFGVGASIAAADIVGVSTDKTKYGHVANLGNRCAPTATANSFAYLQNAYPNIFKDDNRIVRDAAGTPTNDVTKLRDALCDGWGDHQGPRAGTGAAGANLKQWWEGKVTWLDQFAPGKVDYSAMMFNEPDAGTWIRGNKVTSAYPTWDYLWDAINHGCDVELNIIDVAFTNAHALTLTGLQYDDVGDDGSRDATDPIAMSFIDPNDPNDANATNIQPRALTANTTQGGRFEFQWWQDGAQWYIDSALVECPIPAPSVFAVFGVAGIGALRRRRVV